MKPEPKGQRVKTFKHWIPQPDLTREKTQVAVYFKADTEQFLIYQGEHMLVACRDDARAQLAASQQVASYETLVAQAEIDECTHLRVQLASAMVTLEDVPGETLNDRVMRIVEWHHALAKANRIAQDQLASARKALEAAPRPFQADPVAYMDWFFKTRGAALTNEQGGET